MRRPSTLWRVHVAVVVVTAVGLLVAGLAHGDSTEPNPLAAGFYLVLLLVGMPWSIVLIAVGTAVGGGVDDLPVWSGDVLVVVAAGVNLALHRWIRRRRAPAED